MNQIYDILSITYVRKTVISSLTEWFDELLIAAWSFHRRSLSWLDPRLFLHLYDARTQSFIDWNDVLLRFLACRSSTASDLFIERLKHEIKLSPQEISISRRRTVIWRPDWRAIVNVLGPKASPCSDLQLSLLPQDLILARCGVLRVFTKNGGEREKRERVEKMKLWGMMMMWCDVMCIYC